MTLEEMLLDTQLQLNKEQIASAIVSDDATAYALAKNSYETTINSANLSNPGCLFIVQTNNQMLKDRIAALTANGVVGALITDISQSFASNPYLL